MFSSPWVWIAGAAVGWVFLGLVAGRFSAARRGLHSAKTSRRASSRRAPASA